MLELGPFFEELIQPRLTFARGSVGRLSVEPNVLDTISLDVSVAYMPRATGVPDPDGFVASCVEISDSIAYTPNHLAASRIFNVLADLLVISPPFRPRGNNGQIDIRILFQDGQYVQSMWDFRMCVYLSALAR